MTMTAADGKLIAEVPRLGLQPLENIPLLIADLKKSGAKLNKGDFISLDSPAAPLPIPGAKSHPALLEYASERFDRDGDIYVSG